MVSVGPDGITVSVNTAVKLPALAVTVTAPVVLPASTWTEAWPALFVIALVAESTAGPVMAKLTAVPEAGPLAAVQLNHQRRREIRIYHGRLIVTRNNLQAREQDVRRDRKGSRNIRIACQRNFNRHLSRCVNWSGWHWSARVR